MIGPKFGPKERIESVITDLTFLKTRRRGEVGRVARGGKGIENR